MEELGCQQQCGHMEELPRVVRDDAPEAPIKHGGDCGPGQRRWPGPGVGFCIGCRVFERGLSLNLKK